MPPEKNQFQWFRMSGMKNSDPIRISHKKGVDVPVPANKKNRSTSSASASTSSSSSSGNEKCWRVNEDFVEIERPRYSNLLTTDPSDMFHEYVLDEVDFAWLELMNEDRQKEGMNPITPDTMEWIMTRLDLKAFLKMPGGHNEVDPCCVCKSSVSGGANKIVYCDMCNLAVHQECYGVYAVYPGYWCCHSCLHGREFKPDCLLCPVKGGAYKTTTQREWVHVICAIWHPETYFSNESTLDNVEGVDKVSAERKRCKCYLCDQKSPGACIKCTRRNCKRMFHPTCAMITGLRMKRGKRSYDKHSAFCHEHGKRTTPSSEASSSGSSAGSSSGLSAWSSSTSEDFLEIASQLLEEAEDTFASSHKAQITISESECNYIASGVIMQGKNLFFKKLVPYWRLKRSSLRGGDLVNFLLVTKSQESE